MGDILANAFLTTIVAPVVVVMILAGCSAGYNKANMNRNSHKQQTQETRICQNKWTNETCSTKAHERK